MYTDTSKEFDVLIAGASRHFYCKLSRDGEEYTTGFRSVKISGQANIDTDKLSVGGTVATTVEISMDKPTGQVTGKEYQLSFGLEIDGIVEYCPVCMITAEKPKENDGVLTFTAYDRMVSRFNQPYFTDISSFPVDGKVLLQEISEKTGVEIVNLSDLPDGIKIDYRTTTGEDGNPSKTNPFDGYTYREAVKYLAQIYGKFAVMNRIGELEFRWYSDSGYTVELNRSQEDITSNEIVYTVQKIECTVNQEILTSGSGTTGIQIENPVMTQDLLDLVFDQIGGMSYLPTTLSFLGDCRLDLGDIVTVKTKSGVDIKVPIMSLEHEFDGGLTTVIGSYGGTEAEESSSVKGPTAQAIDRVYTDLFLVKEVLSNKVSTVYLEANYATIKQLDAVAARIEKIVTTEITAEYLEANYAQINMANVNIASIEKGFLQELMVEQGLLADRVVSEEVTVTNCLTGVSILANDIVAGRLDAAEIEVVNLDCANLTVGQINGKQIAPGAIDMDNLEESLSTSITNTATDVEKALKEAGLAKEEAATAQKTADGKNTVFYGEDDPTGAQENDIWFKDSTIYIFDGTNWIQEQFAAEAIADDAITEEKIAADVNAKISEAFSSAGLAISTANSATTTANNALTVANGIEIGGRNLLFNTGTMDISALSADSSGASVKGTATNADGGIRIVNEASNVRIWLGPSPKLDVVTGEQFTISFYYKMNSGPDEPQQIQVRYWVNGAVTKVYSSAGTQTKTASADGWIRVVDTFTVPLDGQMDVAFRTGADYTLYTNDFMIRKFKLERGNRATDWSPAPDDLYQEISDQGIANWCYNNDLTYIDGGRIYTGTVTAEKLKAKTITAASGVIADAAILTANIADLAVSTAKIANLAIGTAKIADLAVTNAKLANLSVTNAKIADATIQSAKIANLDAGKITSGYISADRINAGSITYAKLSSAAVASINALIEVGGRNLLPNTQTMDGYGCSTYVTLEKDNEGFTVATYNANETLAYNSLKTMEPILFSQLRNKTVSFSFWVRSDDYESINAISGHGLHIDARIYAATSSDTLRYAVALSKETNYQLSDEWQKVVITATFTDDYFKNGTAAISDDSRFVFIVYNYSNYTMQVKKLKLELGNKATDWTPNPEDVYEEIAEQGIGNWCYNNDLTYINGGKIYTGTITTAKLAAGAITTAKIAAGAVTATQIAAGTITADKIATGTITATKIASQTITADKIVAGAITANEIAASAITAAKIASSAITTAKIAAGAVTAEKISVSSLEAIVAKIGGFTINSTALYNGTSSKTSTTAGIYLGTDAIRAYSSSTAYTHIEKGKLTCVGAEIKGDMTILGSLKMICSSYNETAFNVIKQTLVTGGVKTEFCGYGGDVLFNYATAEGSFNILLDTAISGDLQCTGDFQCSGAMQATTITATSSVTGAVVKTTAGANLDSVKTSITNETKLSSWNSNTIVTDVTWYKTRGFVFTRLNSVSGATFDNLPSGYRPASKVWCPVIVQNLSGGWFNGWIGIGTDGSIVIQATGSHGATSWVNCKTASFAIFGNVMFYVG